MAVKYEVFLLLAIAAVVLCLALEIEGRHLPRRTAMKRATKAKRQVDICPIPYECGEDSLKCFTVYGGECIPVHWICDGIRDCFDGLDEKYCGSRKRSLNSGLVQIKKSCIDLAKRGKLHARQATNGTDGLYPCYEDSFYCANPYGECLPSDWWCDTIQDCFEGEDELGCNNENVMWEIYPCHDGAYHCDNAYGACMSPAWECDGVEDCFNGQDENQCEKRKRNNLRQEPSFSEFQPSWGTFTCGPKSFNCPNSFGDCIPGSWTCDGVEDCEEGQDEVDCESSD